LISFKATNYFSKPVTLSWNYHNKNQDTLTSQSDATFVVEGDLNKGIEFTSRTPLKPGQLSSMVYFKAISDGSQNILVNNQQKYNVKLTPYGQQSKQPTSLNILEKGLLISCLTLQEKHSILAEELRIIQSILIQNLSYVFFL